MAPIVIRVPLGERSYPIVVGSGHLRDLPAWLRRARLGRDAVIVTNQAVRRRCAASVTAALAAAGYRSVLLLVPDTERAKSLGELARLLNRLAACDGVGRQLFIVALGGGVVGDLAGVAAALYRRGIPYVQLPTTLLAQVDSSIGGKTAVDLPRGKNLVGAFYQPRLVFVETAWLGSLPARQLVSGMAEVIKSGLIRDPALVRFLTRRRAAILRRDPAALRTMIARTARIKAAVVARDERESSGYRTILNFGHTVGHALEAAARYRGPWTHGEAVAIGMRAAVTIAERLGLCRPAMAAQVQALLDAYRLPRRAVGVRPAAVLSILAHDKKVTAGRLRWVLPTRLGHVLVTPDVPAPLVCDVVREFVRP